jgi:GNAT superfamily N-acetyltransferase
MVDINIVTYSPNLELDDKIKVFIEEIIINEFRQPIVRRKDLEDLSIYSGNSIMYILLINRIVSGTIGVIAKENEAIIKRFYLKKEIRNKGYGTMLFNKAIEHVKKLNINLVRLNCDTKKMKQAFIFYKKRGFKIESMRKDGYAKMYLKLDNN